MHFYGISFTDIQTRHVIPNLQLIGKKIASQFLRQRGVGQARVEIPSHHPQLARRKICQNHQDAAHKHNNSKLIPQFTVAAKEHQHGHNFRSLINRNQGRSENKGNQKYRYSKSEQLRTASQSEQTRRNSKTEKIVEFQRSYKFEEIQRANKFVEICRTNKIRKASTLK